MTNFLQQLINGLSIGSVYALMAVGYSLVYSIMNFSNFAHGGVIMFGAYFGFFFMTLYKLSFIPAFLISGICTGILAVIVERIAYKPLRNRKAPFLYFIISAMGVSIFLENIVIATIGPTFRTYPKVFSLEPIRLGKMAIGRIDLTMFLISMFCVAALIYLIDFTKTGKAIQATAFNMKGSALWE
ncbi:branched-chain amino acid ABC transporter permease [Fervidicella metallireducens]|uniref:branched-chain amino acid ABC transporter permease n=1 Tax=Fervidicella metallireducens TaxID=655338 RepID=UPI000A836880|nr:branched-chain amino acid ABC transporter permease [Fervidicella metallireducens]